MHLLFYFELRHQPVKRGYDIGIFASPNWRAVLFIFYPLPHVKGVLKNMHLMRIKFSQCRIWKRGILRFPQRLTSSRRQCWGVNLYLIAWLLYVWACAHSILDRGGNSIRCLNFPYFMNFSGANKARRTDKPSRMHFESN